MKYRSDRHFAASKPSRTARNVLGSSFATSVAATVSRPCFPGRDGLAQHTGSNNFGPPSVIIATMSGLLMKNNRSKG